MSAASVAPAAALGASPASLSLYHGRWLLTQSSGGIGFAGTSYATVSKSDWKSWHPLAAPLMRLQTSGGFMPMETAEWMIINGGREEESGTNVLVWRHASSTNGADNATPLSIPLDGKPHVMGSPPIFAASPASSATHRKAVTLTASQVPAPASALADGGSSVALHLQIDLPPEKQTLKGGKASNFAEEQIALHRAGYILCRSMLPSRGKLVQITEYHRAPASMKNDVVAALDTSQVPTVYAVTRVFQRVERKEDLEDAGPTSSSSSSVPSTPVRQASTRSVSSASASTASASTASAPSTSIAAPSPRPAQILPPPTPEFEPLVAAVAPAAAMSVSDSPNDAASTASSSSSSSASASASASSQPLPPIPFCTLTGVWKVDRTRSDTLEGMMKELNVAWLARKVILALEVLTHIKHDPDQHHCVVTDVSSAGEQATVHYTSGEINEVKTKEGKTIRMCAKEGEEMRVAGVWPNLPAPMLHAPLSFPASEIPWTFPSYLPAPIAPDLKLHPLPYGYLWIHSFLPDIPGGEMQDVRLLLDRDCMVQQTMIIKHRKLVHTTTRYFTKVESAQEKQKSEAEWEEACNAWKAAMAARGASSGAAQGAHTRTASRAGMDTTSEDNSDDESMLSSPAVNGSSSLHSSRSISRSSTGLLTPIPPSPHLTPGMLGLSPNSGAPPNPLVPVPDLSGVWVVWKERSNDLGVLLKRMGVPWIYRAFANTVDIRTTITHTTKELILKDSSKLGSHSQVFKLDGSWAPVVQYGNQRHGQCKVSSDPLAQSVTVETVYFAANAGRSKISLRQARAEAQAASQQTPLVEERPSSTRGSRSGSSAHSSAPPTPSLNESLLTGESPLSPAPAALPKLALDEVEPSASASSSDSIRLAPDGLLIEPLPMPAAAPANGSSGPSPARSTDPSPRLGPRSLRADSLSEPELVPAASASSVPATPAAASSSSSSSAASAVPALFVRTSDEPGHSRSASSSLLVQSSMPSTPAAGAASIRNTPSTPASTTSSASSSAFSSPNVLAPAQGSMAITSRVIDIRCLLSPDLMRQVITYLEFEVVICVCSRYYRREQTPAEKKAIKAAEEQRKRDEQEAIKRAQKEEEQKRKKDEAERRSGGKGSGASTPGGAPGSASYAAAGGAVVAASAAAAAAGAAGSSSAASAAAPAAPAPVSVVLPSPALSSASSSSSASSASSSAASSSSLAHLFSSASQSLSLSSVTPTRAFLFLLLSVAVCSGHRLLMLCVLAGVAAYAWMLHQQLLLQQEEQRKLMGGVGAGAPAAFVPPAAAMAPQGNAPFTAPILPIGRGLQVEVVPLRRTAHA